MAENSVINMLKRGQESTDKLKALLVQHKLPIEFAELENISGVFTEAVAMLQNVVASTMEENDMYTNSSKKRRTQLEPKFGGRKRYKELPLYAFS